MTIRYKKVFIFTALVILTLSLHAMTSEVSIELLAEKLQMEKGTLATRLQSNEYSLVPLINQREHRELWSAILSPDKFEYMQYYATGKKRTEQEMDKAFYDRLRRMWEIDGLPEMLSFISVYKGSP
ncbi:MAG: hypothetical protein LBQ26_00815, partial [Holosporales bacterium]|nr:hypothetical protein [Holosporales bacterium]